MGNVLTSLRKRLDATIAMLAIVREKIKNCRGYPPCCLTFHKDNRISCDVLGPMTESVFLTHCKKCREMMVETLGHMYQSMDRESTIDKKGSD